MISTNFHESILSVRKLFYIFETFRTSLTIGVLQVERGAMMSQV